MEYKLLNKKAITGIREFHSRRRYIEIQKLKIHVEDVILLYSNRAELPYIEFAVLYKDYVRGVIDTLAKHYVDTYSFDVKEVNEYVLDEKVGPQKAVVCRISVVTSDKFDSENINYKPLNRIEIAGLRELKARKQYLEELKLMIKVEEIILDFSIDSDLPSVAFKVTLKDYSSKIIKELAEQYSETFNFDIKEIENHVFTEGQAPVRALDVTISLK